MTIFNQYLNRYAEAKEEEYSLQEYLDICKSDPSAYATAAERMLMAIGEPELVDTRRKPRLSRLFSNKVIKIYPAFAEFYGMEDSIEQVVSYFRHAAQGREADLFTRQSPVVKIRLHCVEIVHSDGCLPPVATECPVEVLLHLHDDLDQLFVQGEPADDGTEDVRPVGFLSAEPFIDGNGVS